MDERLFPVDEVKRCSTCKEVKPLDEFNRRSAAKDGRQWSCRDCNKAYHYAHWDRHMAQIKARRERQREIARAFIVEYLRAHPCVDCGEADVEWAAWESNPDLNRLKVCRSSQLS